MSPRYMDALSEVDYIVNGLEISELSKIPENFRNFIKNNKSKYYDTNFLKNDIEVQKLKEETRAILAIIYRKYLAPVEEREKLEREYHEKILREKKELANNKKVEIKEIDYSPKVLKSEEPMSIHKEYKKEKWYEKLLNKIKLIFKIGC